MGIVSVAGTFGGLPSPSLPDHSLGLVHSPKAKESWEGNDPGATGQMDGGAKGAFKVTHLAIFCLGRQRCHLRSL